MPLDSFPVSVTLRDGVDVTLSPLQPSDSGALLSFYSELPEQDRAMLRDDVTSPEWAEGFLRMVENRQIISLVALVDEEVVSEASLYHSRHGWTRHVGEIRMTVAPRLRRKGLATAMASALVHLAIDLGLEKLIVQVVDDQLAARRTFERLGFHKEATLPNHVMDVAGTKRDLLLMANTTSQIRAALEAAHQELALQLI
jgi:RimJ/RimL family protein N-acetyltransferase